MSRFMQRYRSFVRDTYQIQEVIPWWKGYVTESYASRRYTVAPIGFNILFHLVYSLYLWIARYPAEFDRFRQQQGDNRRRVRP